MFSTEQEINKIYDDITTEKNKFILELKNINLSTTDPEIIKENTKKRMKIEKKIGYLESIQKSIVKFRLLI